MPPRPGALRPTIRANELFGDVRPERYYVVEDWGVGYWAKMHPQYDGMPKVISRTVGQTHFLDISEVKILTEPGMAFFRRPRLEKPCRHTSGS